MFGNVTALEVFGNVTALFGNVTALFGNVTALEGLHVIREIQELEYDARMLQARRLVFSHLLTYP